jgi:hypothetical protein
MVRLNIEDHAFCDPRVHKVAREVRRGNYDVDELSTFAVLGMLATLWHETQSEGKLKITPEECDRLLIPGISKVLVAAGYLHLQGDTLRVVGNEHQLACLNQRKVKARNAAKKRWTSDEINDNHLILPDVHAPSIEADAKRCITMHEDAQGCMRMPHDAQDQVQDQDQDQDQSNTNTIHVDSFESPMCTEEVIDQSTKMTSKSNATISRDDNIRPALSNVRAPRLKLKEGHVSPLSIVEIWNKFRHPSQPSLKALTADRVRKINSKLKEFPTSEQWEAAVTATANWKFGQGQNDSGWVASIDWLVSSKGTKAFDGSLGGNGVRKGSNGGTDYRDQSYRGDDNAILRAFGEGDDCEPF